MSHNGYYVNFHYTHITITRYLDYTFIMFYTHVNRR